MFVKQKIQVCPLRISFWMHSRQELFIKFLIRCIGTFISSVQFCIVYLLMMMHPFNTLFVRVDSTVAHWFVDDIYVICGDIYVISAIFMWLVDDIYVISGRYLCD